MTDAPAIPTRTLRWLARGTRWALALMLVFWLVLLAAWAGLHGWIVPRIDDWRPQLQAQASRALGVPVRVGALSAHRQGWFPVIELSDVALLDPQGREALRLPRVTLVLSARALLRLGVEQLYVENPELQLRRAPDGRIFVAGLPLAGGAAQDEGALDWLLEQPEIAIRGGQLQWSDELRGAPPLALTQLDLVLRNGHWRHALRLDATPPPAWGERFSLRALLREPLLSTRSGAWERWSGELYAMFPRVEVAQLKHHADLGGVQVGQGRGALRAWAQVAHGQIAGATLDLALADVDAQLAADVQPLQLQTLTGRVAGQRLAEGFELSSQGLQFLTRDALHWPGANLLLRHHGAGPAARGELSADRIDLAALTRIARSLPLAASVHDALGRTAPRGQVSALSARWQGPIDAPTQYQVRAKASALALADVVAPGTPAAPSMPGLRGAQLELDFNQAGGRAGLRIANGALTLPGVFEDPVLPLSRLTANVRWQVQGEQIHVQASELRFANADAEGEARLEWHTADPKTSSARARFPGVLQLSGTLSRANGARVHRYLPLEIPADARHYVRDAIIAGRASQVRFRVKGDLHDFPYGGGEAGEFHIAAQVQGATYRYVPPSLTPAAERPWPALTNLSGQLVFDRAGMQVLGASAGIEGAPQLRARGIRARIPDLEHSVVDVDAAITGPLAEMLTLARGSAIAQFTQGALDEASASGGSEVTLALTLPIDDLERARVRGNVALTGNPLRLTPDTPQLTEARGAVQFSETGFRLAGVTARALGGPVQLSGGTPDTASGAAGAPLARVHAQGSASAEGLASASELGALAQLAQRASGNAAYALALDVRRGVTELQLTSDLRGMALNLPAPLAKAAHEPLALHYQNRLTEASAASARAPLRDELTIELGDVARLWFLRALEGAHPRVLAGSMALGAQTRQPLTLPAQGVSARASLAQLDADAWQRLLSQAAPGGAGAAAGHGGLGSDYLPTRVRLAVGRLQAAGRSLHDVAINAQREGEAWHAQVDARELSGRITYHPAGSADAPQGRVQARLARLVLEQSADAPIDGLLDAEQPSTLPALDIVVDDLQLHGRPLGRLAVEASNRSDGQGQREWRLQRLNLQTPEATLTSSGNWALLAGSRGERRTALKLQLDIRDAGALLARFGMDGVLRKGHGSIAGELGWVGSPLSPDWRSMAGALHLDVQSGQFLKADPGLAKLLGVLSLQSLPRRLALDFRDVFSEGFAFDFVRGDTRIAQGIAQTNNLQMKGVNAAVLMEGSADIARETQDLHVVVIPEINAMTASLVATAINPVIGLGSFLAQAFLRGPLMAAATQEFRIDGSWADPRVERIDKRKGAGTGAGEKQ